MRIIERLARLERTEHADSRMPAAEIEAAAARYQGELISDGTPCGRPVAVALMKWLGMVKAAEPWLQHIYAGMSPADAHL
jgi:hypothetical protein